jgi:hypothetical protein
MVDDEYDLQKDLLKSIHEFTYRQYERSVQSGSNDEPLPATHSELIIMALIDIGRPASAEDINLWITRLLGADYREHRWSDRLGYPAKSLLTIGRLGYPAKSLLTIGDLLYHAFDLPVIEVPPEPRINTLNHSQTPKNETQQSRSQNTSAHETSTGTTSAADSTLLPGAINWRIPPSVEACTWPAPPKYTTPTLDAALFLRRRLFSPWSPNKHFPIMKLPVELREYIFKYALALPPGACLRTKEPCRNCRGDLCERWEISAPRWREVSSSKRCEVDSDFLALLRVSKTFYQEASPCLWSSDILVSGNAPKLCRLLRGAMGWKYVRQIDLKLRDGGDQCAFEEDDDEIALLATMPRLRKLIVRLTPLRVYSRKEGILKVPSVVSLRKHVRGLEELVIYGPLENCEDVLRAELMGSREVSDVP